MSRHQESEVDLLSQYELAILLHSRKWLSAGNEIGQVGSHWACGLDFISRDYASMNSVLRASLSTFTTSPIATVSLI